MRFGGQTQSGGGQRGEEKGKARGGARQKGAAHITATTHIAATTQKTATTHITLVWGTLHSFEAMEKNRERNLKEKREKC